MVKRLWWTSALGFGVLTALAPPALAQTASAPPSSASAPQAAPQDSNQVAEIIVTANRQSEALSRVGVSVTALGADLLTRNNVKTADDLVGLVPGFQVTQSYGGAEVYTLRGIGFNTPNASATSPIGVYIDQAALPYPYMAEGVLFDIDRVEVLKGPQGTLYGRNTTGGLIDYITAKSTSTFQAGGSVEGGNYSTFDASGYVSGPVNDWVRLRLAVDTQNRYDGWQKSVTTGDTLGVLHQNAFRGTADFGNGGPFEATLTATYWNKHGDTLAPQAIADIVPGTNPAGVAFESPSIDASVIKPTSDTQADFLQQNNQPLASIGRYHPSPVTQSSFASVNLNASYKLNPNLKVVSLTSYDTLDHADNSDAEGTNTESVFIASSGTIQSFSEELRLLGDYGRFKWSVGGYYARDLLKDNDLGYVYQNSTIAELRYVALVLAPSFGLQHTGFTNQQVLDGFGNFHDVANQTATVAAGFANAEYKLNDLLKFTLGGRVTRDSISFAGCTYDTDGTNAAVIDNTYPLLTGNFTTSYRVPTNGCYTLNTNNTAFVPIVDEKQEKTNFSWRANVDVTPNPTTLIYGTISRGFKAGGFPILAASNQVQFAPVQQEQLTAYEVGAKVGLFDRRVQLDGAVFYYDYENKQVYGRIADLIFGKLTRIRNIPQSREFGLEGDATWRVTSYLTATVAGAYLDTHIGSYVDIPDVGPAANYDGHPFPYTPQWQGNASLVYDAPITDRFRLNASVTETYQDVSHADVADLQILKIAPYLLTDATLGIAPNGGKWTAGLYVKNLFDKYYYTGASTAIETAYRYPGMPRTYGVRLTYKY